MNQSFPKNGLFLQTQTGCISCANKWANVLTSANQKKKLKEKCTRLRVRCLQSSCGRNQLNYIVSDWLNKMALCFPALAMCTRPIFSENGKLAFRHRGTASHMCKTGQTRSFTPKKRVPSGSKNRCSPRCHYCENWPGLGVK